MFLIKIANKFHQVNKTTQEPFASFVPTGGNCSLIYSPSPSSSYSFPFKKVIPNHHNQVELNLYQYYFLLYYQS